MTYEAIATTRNHYEQPEPEATTYTAINRETARHMKDLRIGFTTTTAAPESTDRIQNHHSREQLRHQRDLTRIDIEP